MAKDLVSFPELATGDGALDLLADAVRKSAGQDGKQDKNTFKAIVLRSVSGGRVKGKDHAGAAGSSHAKNPTRISTITRAYFVRIVDDDSPHAYLPNPCAQGATGLAETPNNHLIQGLHTYALHENSEKPLAPNTIVYVRLNKVDFSYDTDIGWITSVEIGSADTEIAKEFKCSSPRDAYNEQDISTLAEALGITDRELDPIGITMHYTAGSTIKSSIVELALEHKAYHYIIDRDGSITNLAPPDKVVIHDPATNNTHIGISFANLGYQEAIAGRGGSPPIEDWIVGPDPRNHKIKKWEPFTSAQISAAKNLVRELKSKFPKIKEVTTHSHTAPGRKADPGPAFDPYLEGFQALV